MLTDESHSSERTRKAIDCGPKVERPKASALRQTCTIETDVSYTLKPARHD